MAKAKACLFIYVLIIVYNSTLSIKKNNASLAVFGSQLRHFDAEYYFNFSSF